MQSAPLWESTDVKEPQPQDYGLSPPDVVRLEAWEAKLFKRIAPPIWIGTMLLSFVAGFRERGVLLGVVYCVGIGTGMGFFAIQFGLPALAGLARLVRPDLAAFARYTADRKLYDSWLKQTRYEYWRALSGVEFEKALARLFQTAGYETRLTPPSGDHGIDIVLGKDGRRIVVQCKATAKPVGPAVVRELLGALYAEGGDLAVLASVGGVTNGVRDFVGGKPIIILGLPEILDLHSGNDPIDRWLHLRSLLGPQAL